MTPALSAREDRVRRVEGRLRVVGAMLALMSLAALLAHVFGVLPMVFFLTYFGVPSVLLLFAMAAWAKKIDARLFLNALAVGVVGGFIATLVYDVVRYLIRLTHIFDYDGFVAIHIFGSWISGQPTTSTAAAWAGWSYHFWNGIAFGVFYTLIFGRRHWLYGVAYGLFIELCTLGIFPLFLLVNSKLDFIIISLVGHVCYGAALGLVAQRYALSWRETS